MGTLNHYIFLLLFSNDGLVLWYEGLHDAPTDEVGDGTEGEDDHIGSGLAFEAHDLEVGALLCCPGEEDA